MICRRHFVLASTATLAGCVNLEHSTPLPADALRDGLRLERSLPRDLPDKSTRFEHSQYVLLASENAANLLVPVPFLGEVVGTTLDRIEARRFEEAYAALDPYALSQLAWSGSPAMRPGGRLVLRPFVFVQECIDDRFRLSLVHRFDGDNWHGRYLAHLPTAWGIEAFSKPSPATLGSIGRELRQAAGELRRLLERDAAGEFARPIATVDIGSLHLVGGRAAGVLSPTLQHARSAELLEETADHVVVRMQGVRTLPASGGALMFGMHLLRRDQLDRYQRVG